MKVLILGALCAFLICPQVHAAPPIEDFSDAVASTQEGQSLRALEANGIFFDGQFPLPGLRERVPPVNSDCRNYAREWNYGYTAGLAGQHWLYEIHIPDRDNRTPAALSPSNPGRQACRQTMDGSNTPSSGSKREALRCCLWGAKRGSDELHRVLASSSIPADDRTQECKREYHFGKAARTEYCGVCAQGTPWTQIRYLGCFTLGFRDADQECHDHDHRHSTRSHGSHVCDRPGSRHLTDPTADCDHPSSSSGTAR